MPAHRKRGLQRHKTVGDRTGPIIQVRRLHRRDLNKVWEFLKRSFRDVNLETVEYQRPRSKKRFYETYEEEGVEQLLFVADGEIVAYTECTYEIIGSDTWINPRYFEKRDMRPLFVEELAVHPDWHGRGVGSFVLEQIQHLAKVRGLTHLVLEVAENNAHALLWYRKRGFRKLDAAVFMAYAVDVAPELLPPRALPGTEVAAEEETVMVAPVDQGPSAKKGKVSRKAKGRAATRGKVGGKKVEAKKAEPKVEPKKVEAKKVEAKKVEKPPVVEAAVEKPLPAGARPGTAPAVGTRASTAPVPGATAPPVVPARASTDGGTPNKNGQRRGQRAESAPPIVPALPGRRRP